MQDPYRMEELDFNIKQAIDYKVEELNYLYEE